MLALPGSAYLYQGEELGLPEVIDLPDEVRQDPAFFRARPDRTASATAAGCRCPWSGTEAPYGFGPATGGPSWLPQPDALGAPERRGADRRPASTLELYRAALALRRDYPALGAGAAVTWLDAPEGVLAFRRDTAERPGLRLHGEPHRATPVDAPGARPRRCCPAPPGVDRRRPPAAPDGLAPVTAVVTIAADTAIWWAI